MIQSVIILITIEPSSEREVLEKLKSLPNVTEAHFLYGPYDAYIRADARTTEELNQLIIDDIRGIKGIRSTTTCFLAE